MINPRGPQPRRRIFARYRAAICRLESRTLLSAELAADINTAPQMSSVFTLTSWNGAIFYGRSTDTYGTELWRTDGTAAGTSMLADLATGSTSATPNSFIPLPSRLLFSAGGNFYATDGTTQGTRRIGGTETGSDWVILDNVAYFRLSGELYRSDGTASGTTLVKDIRPGSNNSYPQAFTRFKDKILFSADDGVHGRELWITDGTAAGTMLYADLEEGATSSEVDTIVIAGDRIVVRVEDEWGIDYALSLDTSTSPFTKTEIGTLGPRGNPTLPLFDVAGMTFISPSIEGTTTLRRMDRVTGAITNLGEIPYGVKDAKALNGGVLLSVGHGTGGAVWFTDGTPEGTFRLCYVGDTFGPSLGVAGNRAFFGSKSISEVGRELWTTDGTIAGTHLVKDLLPGAVSSIPDDFVEHAGSVVFLADNAVGYRVLARSDGTELGTGYLPDREGLTASSDPSRFTRIGNCVVFVARTPALGIALWSITEGSSDPELVLDLGGSAIPPFSTPTAGGVFFTNSTTANGEELWFTDGTAAGTRMVKDISPSTSSSVPRSFTPLPDGSTLFIAYTGSHGNELWRTDGTAGGTFEVADLWAGTGSSSPTSLTRLTDGRVAFFAADASGRSLWVTDGSTAGTSRIGTLPAPATGTTASTTTLQSLADGYYFLLDARDLWHVDPSLAQLSMRHQFAAEFGFPAARFVGATPERLLVTTGSQVWTSDGTNTTLLRTLRPANAPSVLIPEGYILFAADGSDLAGEELWRSDGTSAGTYRVTDLATPTFAGSSSRNLRLINGIAYFSANDGVHGTELWAWDGVSATLAEDVFKGGIGSMPGSLSDAGGDLWFAADDGTHGAEPFRLDDMYAPRLSRASFILDGSGPRVKLTLSEGLANAPQVQVRDRGTGQILPGSDYETVINTVRGTITLSFHVPLSDGNYRVELDALVDARGNTSSASFDFRYLAGDANGDARVDFADLLIVAQHYGQAVTGYAQGDFDFDGSVDFDDVLIIAQGYGRSLQAVQDTILTRKSRRGSPRA